MPCNNIESDNSSKICEPGGSGLILPLGGDWENSQNLQVRAGLYLTLLLWSFGGVSIIADVFMSAIENITSQRVRVWDESTGKFRTATVWNATVANLTLMALGSSAPEILLNVIGIFPTFMSGDLGPSTIVGSAAFNLMVIIAVCVVALPDGEVKKIKDLSVYAITGFSSIFAYIWVLYILAYSTPDVVEAWEGIMTFAFFWVLVVLAYLADRGLLPGTSKEESTLVVGPNSTKEELHEMEKIIRAKHGYNLSPDEESRLIKEEFSKGQSRAVLRVASSRLLTGGRKLFVVPTESMYDRLLPGCSTGSPQIGFVSGQHTLLESAHYYDLDVRCSCKLSKEVTVKYVVKDGSAKNPIDYKVKETEGELKFSRDVDLQSVTVQIIRSTGEYKEDKDFSVQLLNTNLSKQGVSLVQGRSTAQVVIVDEDRPGTISFEEEFIDIEGYENPAAEESGLRCLFGCSQSRKSKRDIPITVLRKDGSAGYVSCHYETESDSATEGADFERIEGTLNFGPKETKKLLYVRINPRGRYDPTEMFRVILSDITGGATFDSTRDGGADSAILTITIHGDAVRKVMQVNWDRADLGNAKWRDQFMACRYVGGSRDDQDNATCFDWIAHFVFLPWRILAAFVPPPQYCGGWLCFFCALFTVGLVTVIIGDAAELLGCCMDIAPSTTAITLVALGTSLPDTFASKTAARMDPCADACIGNVTGSNSVNVFLGLGLPWMICALYWVFVAECSPGDAWSKKFPEQAAAYPSGIFIVEAGALGFSVMVFTICALLCIATLAIRRKLYKGEIGGPRGPAYITCVFFVLLWVAYIVLSIQHTE